MTPHRSEAPTLSLSYPADALAAIPYLLGFHPTDSVVVLAIRGRHAVLAARHDLPPGGAPEPAPAAGDSAAAGPGATVAGLVAHLAAAVRQQSATAAIVVGYGPAQRVR